MKLSRIGGGLILAVMCTALLGAPANAENIFDGNILFNNFLGAVKPDTLCGHIAGDVVWSYYDHNDICDPMLGDPYNESDPDWRPSMSGCAVCPNDTVVNIMFHPDMGFHCEAGASPCAPWDLLFQQVPYRGALKPAEWGPDWTEGWTYFNYDGAGRTDIDTNKVEIEYVNEELSEPDELLWTADKQYKLYGKNYVPAGHTLVIEPGVLVRGDRATHGYLVIERGAKIHAVGTAEDPIVMTSAQPFGEMAPSDWGGLVLHGLARANCAACSLGASCESEGGAGYFCGNNDCDDSGTMKYVRVEYAGNEIAPNNELNAFTMNALGCNTDISYCQAHRGSDDQFEWFGGTNFVHHIVGTGGWDDGVDWQAGFRGGVQFAVIHGWVGTSGDRGIEADNWEYGYDDYPRSKPVIANCTFVGPHEVTSNQSHGMKLRRGTNFEIYNCIAIGWPEYGVDFDHDETFCTGFYPETGAFCPPAEPATIDEDVRRELGVSVSPNPVREMTSFSFALSGESHAEITVFDTNGRIIDTVCDRVMAPGAQSVTWNVPASVGTGTYFYRVATDQGVSTGRLFTVAR